jgi:hypothetical protein
MQPVRRVIVFCLLSVVLASCLNPAQQQTGLRVRLFVEGKELALSTDQPITVRQLLERNNIPLGVLDRIEPPDFTLITDNLSVTIVRVREERECKAQEIPFGTKQLPRTDLQPGQTRVGEAGVNGEAQVCFQVIYEDNVEKSRNQSSYTVLKQPRDQLILVGIDLTKVEPRDIPGMLVYRNAGQGYFIAGNSTNQGPLNTGDKLDGKVFALSGNGRTLLFTRRVEEPTDEQKCKEANELWVLPDAQNPDSQPLRVSSIFNVFSAEWIPGQPLTFTYSTFDPRPDVPCYQALNDLTAARLEVDGRLVAARPIITPKPLGPYSSWGTDFAWSPDGQVLAWAQADGLGLVDLDKGAYIKLVSFPIYQTTLSRGWLWKPDVAWTYDSFLIAAAVHGKPLGDEPIENSPIFDIVLVQANNAYAIVPQVEQAGMWAAPKFSPQLRIGDTIVGYQAYLKARRPIDSVSSEYDLVVADRDGSNPKAIFPGADREGIKPLEGGEFRWGPDGRTLAVIYQGDIYVVEAATGRATRVTLFGNATTIGSVLSLQWTAKS